MKRGIVQRGSGKGELHTPHKRRLLEPDTALPTCCLAAEQLEHLRSQEARLKAHTDDTWTLQRDATPHMRRTLVAWMLEVAEGFRLTREAFLIAVNLLDRYMALSHVPRHELQLLGVTCLWVSAKYEEVHPPSGANFSAMTQHSCSPAAMCEMESRLLTALGFEVGAPTAATFFECFRLMLGVELGTVDLLARHLIDVATLATCWDHPSAAPDEGVRRCAPLPRQADSFASQPLPSSSVDAAIAAASEPMQAALPDANPMQTDQAEPCLPAALPQHMGASPSAAAKRMLPGSPTSSSTLSSACSSPTAFALLPDRASSPSCCSFLHAEPSGASAGGRLSLSTAAAPPLLQPSEHAAVAVALPSHVAAAALHVALLVEARQGLQAPAQREALLLQMAGLARCSAEHLRRLCQLLLSLRLTAAASPVCAWMVERYHTQAKRLSCA